ncbi:GNAT family N-acetyltransferase [Paenibacillus cellulositrophicus]|uniref:GNAT family N-acetyltransferase n=1 Tax=Paenibacillus cellulositrophicus TaxID=562959 RepID=UPI003D97E78F
MPEISNIRRGTADEANYVRNKLIEFNSKQVPNGIYEEVNLCVKDEKEHIIAGLNSVICWNWMEIDILWVDDEHRGSGHGKRLLEEAEEIARSKQCTFIKLNTFSFQAPEFYKKYGYKEMAVIENAPLGSKHYYFIKELIDYQV